MCLFDAFARTPSAEREQMRFSSRIAPSKHCPHLREILYAVSKLRLIPF
jgi:hypothetical protein